MTLLLSPGLYVMFLRNLSAIEIYFFSSKYCSITVVYIHDVFISYFSPISFLLSCRVARTALQLTDYRPLAIITKLGVKTNLENCFLLRIENFCAWWLYFTLFFVSHTGWKLVQGSAIMLSIDDRRKKKSIIIISFQNLTNNWYLTIRWNRITLIC